MITAKEALTLDSAKLTAEQLILVGKLEADIEAHVRKFMEHRGCDFQTEITDPNVISKVNQHLRQAGFATEWRFIMEKHRLNAAINKCVGAQVSLHPTDESYSL